MLDLRSAPVFTPELPDADRWRTVGFRALEREIERQVLPDGFFYESSTAYHRLALELFLMPALLARRTGYEMPVRYWKRLEQMLEVILHLTRPDGRVPQIGDNDDGRLLILSRYPDWPRHDHRYLLALGAVLFHRGDFKAASLSAPPNWAERYRRLDIGGGGECSHEEVFWLLARKGVEKFDALEPDPTPLGSRAFPDGGLYVVRSEDGKDYALIGAGVPAPHAPTAHAHNDALSLELWLDGHPIFVDSGTYCYTSDVAERNRFRSTMAHNTVMVDGQEINRISPNEAFHLERDAQVKVVEWCVKANRTLLVADHNGYERLESPVCHRRKVQYNSAQHSWLIEEFLQGKGEHTVEVRWHFAPGVEHHVQPLQRGLTIAVGGLELLVSVADVDGWSYRVEHGCTSPSYGVKRNGVILTLRAAFRDDCHLRVVGGRGVASPLLSPNLGAELPASVDADRLKIKTKVG
ncbi:heparinase II/III family protein [Acidobacteria bacterium AH-259-D05]|nr:heparinase II/III family protein [Acidobacteria bacterium AH-259-D05]